MAVTINRYSWLLRSLVRQKNGIQFWDYFEPPIRPEEVFEEREDDIKYTIQAIDRIDNLSQQFYGDPQLWWVIALANDLRLIPNEMKNGRVIKIPSPDFVKERLLIPKTN